MPIRDQTRPVRQVVDGVDTGDGVENCIGEGKSRVGIDDAKIGARGQASLGGEPVCGGDGLVVDIYANQRTAGLCGNAKSRPAGSAPNVQQGFAGIEIQPGKEFVLLQGGEPAVLADVFAECVCAHALVEWSSEVGVVGVVMAGHRGEERSSQMFSSRLCLMGRNNAK
jgi:hypothetical protein